MIDSDSLRQAALQASWHRDHRVARRREAWRWVMFWGWKYGRTIGMIVLTVTLAVWLTLRLEPSIFRVMSNITPHQSTYPAQIPPVLPTIEPPSDAAVGIRLLPDLSLRAGTAYPAPDVNAVAPSTESSHLRLSPAIQAPPKESSP